MQNAELDEGQAGIKTVGRNISSLRYAGDITLMKENEEKLKSLLMNVKKESEKSGLKLKEFENENHCIWSHCFMANRKGNNGNSVRLYFLGLPNHCRW